MHLPPAALALLALALILPGCAGPSPVNPPVPPGNDLTSPTAPPSTPPAPPGGDRPTPPGADVGSGSPAAPVTVGLELADPRAFFGPGSALTLTVRSSLGAPTLRAGVALPPGVTVLSGQLSHDGPMPAGDALVLQGVVRAAQAGEHMLRGWAELPVADGRVAPSALLAVRGSSADASVSYPTSAGLALAVDLRADPADPARLLGEVTSPSAVAARVVLRLSSGLTLAEGAREWSGVLSAGTLQRFAFRVAPAADGVHLASLLVYPDASVDGGLYTDDEYASAAGAQVAWSDREPGSGGGDATPGGGTSQNNTTGGQAQPCC